MRKWVAAGLIVLELILVVLACMTYVKKTEVVKKGRWMQREIYQQFGRPDAFRLLPMERLQRRD
ncbi:hypothetical protein HCJ07_11615 [Listeria booriae]|uniref:Uncharacterized protein n=1 Tax=Listeria booriae TaxID=1552123 RepID=A0A7X0XB65_9LIST|nr:hypothetical protein [Listeria booriae]MBC1490541.1 hypothetical protein [Listeria booriae]MBC1503657.1 hypothetical protein [Listeria booriae]MBC1524824.1 hypothetical protein [Listeria booriae]MBC1530994.1 hypothetical protein [Listeria booriae]